jgi:hypothetical protein
MKRQWSQDELAEHWTLLPDELKLLANKTGSTRLGFSLLLKAFAYQRRFPRHMQKLPATVVVHQAIKTMPAGFQVAARHADGIVEAIYRARATRDSGARVPFRSRS